MTTTSQPRRLHVSHGSSASFLLAAPLLAALVCGLITMATAPAALAQSPSLLTELRDADDVATAPTQYLGGYGATFFFMTTNGSGNQLWTSEGTPLSTVRLSVPGGPEPIKLFITRAGRAFYSGTLGSGVSGYALRVATATSDEAILPSGNGVPSISSWTYSPDADLFYFSGPGANGTFGSWESDGTSAGTVALGSLQRVAFLGASTLFSTNSGDLSVGTAAARTDFLVGDCCDSLPRGPLGAVTSSYFIGTVAGIDYLWQTDGSEGGTERLQALPAGAVTGAWDFGGRFSDGWVLYRNFSVGGVERDAWWVADDGSDPVEILDIPSQHSNAFLYSRILGDHLLVAGDFPPLTGSVWSLGRTAASLTELFPTDDSNGFVSWPASVSNGVRAYYAKSSSSPALSLMLETDGTVAGTSTTPVPGTPCSVFFYPVVPMSGDDVVWRCDYRLYAGSNGVGYRLIDTDLFVSNTAAGFPSVVGRTLYYFREPQAPSDAVTLHAVKLRVAPSPARFAKRSAGSVP